MIIFISNGYLPVNVQKRNTKTYYLCVFIMNRICTNVHMGAVVYLRMNRV